MDDNTFECPNCGAEVYPEMTRCPQCGHNMYPEEAVSTPEEDASTRFTWGKMAGVLLIGWLVSAGISTVINFIIAEFMAPIQLGEVAKMILYLAGPLGALVGGYISAGLTGWRVKLFGGLVGVFTIPVVVLLATHWVRVKLALFINPWLIGIGIMIILAGVCGGWIYEKYSQRESWQEKWKVHGWEDLLYQDLLRKVSFNGSAANRLIEYERNLKPEATRLELLQNAIERWEKDNR